MECAICGNYLDRENHSPDLETTYDGVTSRLHSTCTVCHICKKPRCVEFGILPSGEWLFVHVECLFTPSQMSTILRLQADYAGSQDH